MQDLLLQSGSLFLREIQDVLQRIGHLVVGLGGEIGSLCVAECSIQRFELALGLLSGATETVQRLSCFGFGLMRHDDVTGSFGCGGCTAILTGWEGCCNGSLDLN